MIFERSLTKNKKWSIRLVSLYNKIEYNEAKSIMLITFWVMSRQMLLQVLICFFEGIMK